jgi:hypothetical protein
MAFSECMNFICLQVPSTVSHVCNSNSFVHFILDNVDPSILGPKVPITKFIMDKKKFQASRDIDTKFIFVREPIERLASCYNDKMIVNTVGVLQTRLSPSPSPGYNALVYLLTPSTIKTQINLVLLLVLGRLSHEISTKN